jgi:tetratricopeptide (TPR) repeat protein
MANESVVLTQPTRPARVLVIPFENARRDASILWLGEAAAVQLADDLSALGVPVIAREERRLAFARLQVLSAATLTDATVIRIGELVGAAEVVMGSLQLDGDLLSVHARSIALETGRIGHDITERGPMVEMFTTLDRIARQLSPSRTSHTPEAPQPPPLTVFENYIKGLLAESPATAVKYFRTALAALPTFDRARLALWDVYNDQGEHALALAAVEPVAPDSRWSHRAKFLAGLSYLSLNQNSDAFATFKTLVDGQPTPSALNNVGVALNRRGATTETGPPTSYFNRAAEADPADPDYFFNLGYSYWLARDTPAAVHWLREAVRRNPADGDAHFVLGAALGAAGTVAEAARERELARRLSSRYAEWEKRGADSVPKGLERVKEGIDLPHAQRIESALSSTEQRDQRELARFYVDRGRRLFEQQHDSEAIAELNRALYLSPYDAEAHVLVGRIHLRNNRLREAIDALKISIWSADTAQAHLVLAEAYLQSRDPEAAKREAERAAQIDPASSEARQLLERIGGQ